MPGALSRFTFVFIPAQVSDPLENWSQGYSEENAVECLFDRIKAHFAKNRPQRSAEQQKAHRAQLLSSVPEEQRRHLDENLLSMAANLNLVENVSLLSNATDNNFTGVNLYCADDASFYGAPSNPRASDIASCCGKALDVKGDAFLARVYDNGDDFKRMDLEVSEVSSSASWVKAASQQNERKRAAETPAAAFNRIQQSSAASKPDEAPSASEQARLQGNDAFKQHKYQEALDHYDAACQAEGASIAAFNNRAMAHLKLGQPDEAEADCDRVLAREPRNSKALLRRAAARQALGRLEGAVADCRQVLAIEPHNKEAAERLEMMKTLRSQEPQA